MLRTRRRSFVSPRPRTSSIPPISVLAWFPDRSTIRIALLPPNSWSYHDDESRRRNVTVGRKNRVLRPKNGGEIHAGSEAGASDTVCSETGMNWQGLPFIVAPVGRGRAGCPRCL